MDDTTVRLIWCVDSETGTEWLIDPETGDKIMTREDLNACKDK